MQVMCVTVLLDYCEVGRYATELGKCLLLCYNIFVVDCLTIMHVVSAYMYVCMFVSVPGK